MSGTAMKNERGPTIVRAPESDAVIHVGDRNTPDCPKAIYRGIFRSWGTLVCSKKRRAMIDMRAKTSWHAKIRRRNKQAYGAFESVNASSLKSISNPNFRT